MTVIINGTDNAVGNPAIQGGTGGTSAGLYYPSANTVAITTSGTNALTISSTQTATFAGSVNAPNTFGYKNRLINGNMGISQRATSFTNVGSGGPPTYSLDRWCGWRQGYAANLDISQVTGFGSFQYALRGQRTSGTSGTGSISIAQVIESVNSYDLLGQSVTISFWAKAGSNYSGGQLSAILQYSTSANNTSSNLAGGSWSGSIASTAVTISTTATQYSFTATVPANALSLAVQFNWTPTGTASTNDFIDFSGVQLETGAQATSFDLRDYGRELYLCERYCLAVGDGLSGIARSTTQNLFTFYYTQPMRTAPSVTITDTSISVSDNYSADFTSSGSTADLVQLTSYGGRISVSGYTGLTQGRWYGAFNNTNGYFMVLSAEL